MPVPQPSPTPASAALLRAETLLRHVPGGAARLLWQPLLLVQDEADPLVAVVLAGMGAEVLAVAPERPAWDEAHDAPRFAALARLLETERPDLDPTTARAIGASTIHAALRYTLRETPGAWSELAGAGPFPTVLVDGSRALRADAPATLSALRPLLPVGGVLELVAREGEACTKAELDALERAAIAAGFGVRHAGTALGEPGSERTPALALGLVPLAEPLREHPDNAYVDARRASRLDVAAALVRGRRVLDAGGGEGVGARRYLEAGAASVTVLDVDPATLAAARERVGDDERARFVAWDLDEAPYPFDDGSFDVVVCLETLEHIEAQARAVGELHRVLAPGGRLLVSVPESGFETEALRANAHANPYHRHVPTREELEGWLAPFSDVAWFRQLDAVGSVTLPDEAPATPQPKASLPPGWDWTRARPEVIGALCVKAPRGRARASTTARRLTSRVHVFSEASSSLLELRLAHERLEQRFLEERWRWWCDGNRRRAERAALQARLERARSEAASRADEAARAEELRAVVDRLEHEREQARAEADARAEELRAVVDRLEHEHEQARAEADARAEEVGDERARRLGAEADAHALRERLETSCRELEQARAGARATRDEAAARLARERERADRERAALLERLGTATAHELERLERRCLEAEARLWDLEEPPRENGHD